MCWNLVIGFVHLILYLFQTNLVRPCQVATLRFHELFVDTCGSSSSLNIQAIYLSAIAV